jgi:hypothetical protein
VFLLLQHCAQCDIPFEDWVRLVGCAVLRAAIIITADADSSTFNFEGVGRRNRGQITTPSRRTASRAAAAARHRSCDQTESPADSEDLGISAADQAVPLTLSESAGLRASPESTPRRRQSTSRSPSPALTSRVCQRAS